MMAPAGSDTARGQMVVLIAGVLLLFIVLGVGAFVVTHLDETGKSASSTSTPTGTAADGLTALWVSETKREIGGNHHAAIGARIDGQPLVFAPISGQPHHHGDGNHSGSQTAPAGTRHAHTSRGCALVALNGASGGVRWTHSVPPANCTIHSVADPTLADADGDGTPEVVAPSTRQAVSGYDPLTGTVEFRHNLSAYGYTRPVVTDFVGDARPEVIVVDVHGNAFVFRPNGTTVWQRSLSAYVWGQPHVADFDADNQPELALGLGNGEVHLWQANGTTAWQRQVAAETGGVTWMTTGQIDTDAARELVAATAKGHVAAFDGASGTRQWRRDFGAYAAVHAVGDGDQDGTTEVYVTARDGKLRALTGRNGTIEWTTRLTTADVQMTPPPILADVDGDGNNELVAATNDGKVRVVAPGNGTWIASYQRSVSIFTNPTAANLVGDDGAEIIVMYGDGRVAVLSYDKNRMRAEAHTFTVGGRQHHPHR